MKPGPVVALGVTQIVGYGTLYYAFPIAVPAMAADVGLAQEWLYGLFSAGMLAGGLIAPAVGRAMDRHGAPRVMATGSALAAALLALMPLVQGPVPLALVVLALELVAVAVLYDGAFATLALLRGDGARRAITNLTLIAGFASTVFWPLTGAMVEAIGWRATYGAFALMHLGLALPLHLWLVRQARSADPARAPGAAPPAAPPPPPAVPGAFALMGAGFALSGMLVAALTVHMVPLLQALGLGAAAFAIAAVMGPAQVAIRALNAAFWTRLHPVDVSLIAALALPLALSALLVTHGAAAGVAFAALLGVGGGLASIVRGTLPLAVFGPSGYGALLGRLTGLRTLLAAVAPFLFALLMRHAGPQAAMAAALAVGFAGALPMAVLRARLARAAPPAAAG